MLFYRPEKKTIVRFEPHGKAYQQGRTGEDEVFNKVLTRMFEVEMKPYLKQYTPKFSTPDEICPNPKGFQSLEGQLKGLSQEGGGFCGMWSLFTMELMFLNPEKTTREVMEIAFDITEAKPEYLKNVIRGYVLKTEKLLNDYIKKIDDTESFSFSNARKFYNKKNIIQNQLLSLLVSFGSESSLIESLKSKAEEGKDDQIIVKLLEGKGKHSINAMLKSVFGRNFGDRTRMTETDMIRSIINMIKIGKIKAEDIIKYYNPKKGAGIKICSCKGVSKCGGTKIENLF